MNNIKKLKCNICNKEYERQSAYDKHKLLCNNGEILGNGNKLEELSLRDIVVELIKTNSKLQKDVDELKKWVYIKKKKVIIIDWLNLNSKPNINYKEFISNIVISQEDLKIIFKSNIIDGIVEILENFIRDKNDIPIKSFDQKDNTIYVYNEQCKWEQLSTTEFNSIISLITKNILTEFKKWQDENEDKLYTEEFSPIYLQNVKKVMGGDIPIDKQRNKIHKNIYKLLKMNLQNILEYDFT